MSQAVDMVVSAGSVVFEDNQVVGWVLGLQMRGTNKIVRRNVFAHNEHGIVTSGSGVISGNIVVGNTRAGIVLDGGAAVVSGNAVLSHKDGITNTWTANPSGGLFVGTIEKNNIIGNDRGMFNNGIVGLAAAGNYWGAATGPGADPADDVVNGSGGTTIVTPFATKPFKVKKPLIKP